MWYNAYNGGTLSQQNQFMGFFVVTKEQMSKLILTSENPVKSRSYQLPRQRFIYDFSSSINRMLEER